MYEVSKSADPDQTLRQRRGGWSGSTLYANVPRSLFAMTLAIWSLFMDRPMSCSIVMFHTDMYYVENDTSKFKI